MILDDIKRDVATGKSVECPWEFLRLTAYAGLVDEKAAATLAEWAQANGIDVDFQTRTAHADGKPIDVIYAIFIATTRQARTSRPRSKSRD